MAQPFLSTGMERGARHSFAVVVFPSFFPIASLRHFAIGMRMAKAQDARPRVAGLTSKPCAAEPTPFERHPKSKIAIG